MIYFLHHNAENAAADLLQRDIKPTLARCLRRLQWAHKGKNVEEPTVKWALADGFNYYWLAYFCECLQKRTTCHYWTEILSLRRALPKGVSCVQATPFPLYVKRNPNQSVIEAYRLHYFKSRCKLTKRGEYTAPGWFIRLENSLSTVQRNSKSILSREQPARSNRAADSRSKQVERAPLRNGQIYTSDGKPTGFQLWDGPNGGAF